MRDSLRPASPPPGATRWTVREAASPILDAAGAQNLRSSIDRHLIESIPGTADRGEPLLSKSLSASVDVPDSLEEFSVRCSAETPFKLRLFLSLGFPFAGPKRRRIRSFRNAPSLLCLH